MLNLDTQFECNTINERLRSRYGINEEVNLARFKVCFADDQLEKRLTFDELGNGKEIKEVPKYPWLLSQWVLERLFPNVQKDVYEGVFIYEPLYAYPPGMPLNWDAIEFAVKVALKILPAEMSEFPKTEKEAIYQHEEKLKKEKAHVLNILDNTAVQSALHDGGAVSMAGLNPKKENENVSDNDS